MELINYYTRFERLYKSLRKEYDEIVNHYIRKYGTHVPDAGYTVVDSHYGKSYLVLDFDFDTDDIEVIHIHKIKVIDDIFNYNNPSHDEQCDERVNLMNMYNYLTIYQLLKNLDKLC